MKPVIYILPILIFCFAGVKAQYLTGPVNVVQGQEAWYQFDNGANHRYRWIISGGEIIEEIPATLFDPHHTYKVKVHWTGSGNYSVAFQSWTYIPVLNTSRYVTIEYLAVEMQHDCSTNPPQVYNVAGGGIFCEGSAPAGGASVYLEGNPVINDGLTYYLTDPRIPVPGTAKTGNGTVLKWDNITTTGKYSIAVERDGCYYSMNGEVEYTEKNLPATRILEYPVNICEGDAPVLKIKQAEQGVLYQLYNGAGGVASPVVQGSGTDQVLPLATASENYKLVAMLNGCQVSLNNNISVSLTQIAPIDYYVSSTLLLEGEEAHITVNNIGDYDTFEWYKDGVLISVNGNTLQTTAAGTYLLKGYLNACVETATITIDIISDYTAINGIIENTARAEITDVNAFNTKTDNFHQKTWFIDGIGRTVQTVETQNSPGHNDLIAPITYDGAGRERFQYLPYTSPGSHGSYRPHALAPDHTQSEQYNFYQTAEHILHDEVPYTTNTYENSTLNRIQAEQGPGKDWQGVAVRYVYSTNAQQEVNLWTVDVSTGALVNTGFYPPATLKQTIITDEEGHSIKTYQDRQGRTILKRVQAHENGAPEQWADTYFIYNDLGKLSFVLPPKASEEIANGATIDDDFLAKWAYSYKYDGRQRLTEKRVPGAGWVYMVYDNRDRLVLAQDGNQRQDSTWTFTKYDQLNRPVATGTYKHVTGLSQSEMQTYVNGRIGDEDGWYEAYNGNSTLHGYTDLAFPKGVPADDYLTVTYYDSYGFKSLPGFGAGFNYDSAQLGTETCAQGTYTFPQAEFDRVKGLVTGSKTKVLDGTNTWLGAVTYYDDHYRTVQAITKTHKGTLDKYSSLYNFPGWVLATYTSHQKNDSTTYGIKKRYTYDHAGRQLQVYHEVIDNGSGQGKVLLAEHEYNELGELIDKKLHSEDSGTSFKQSVDYRYNIRGWLKRINGAGLHNDGSEPQDFFGIEFYYQQVDNNLQNTPAYNGNISAVKWSNDLGLSDLEERGYAYTYDALNRLKSAQHHRRLNKNWGSVDAYSVSSINYDLNGNIENLTRKDGFGQNMDMLVYDYGSGTAKSNQLLSVTDGSGNEAGFKDGNTGSQDYFYDHNGNMEKDLNKGIGDIAYNHLNLPAKVTKDTANYIDYIYDATGVKLAQVAHENGKEKRTDYIGEFIYENDTLQLIQHEEGRIVKDETTESWEYQYHLKDHLGNVRLTFTTKPDTLTFAATFESENAVEEDKLYFNIQDTRETFNNADANADGGDEVVRLNGTQPAGPGISLPVGAGDKIDMEVFGYYEGGTGYSSTTTTTALISAVAGAFGGVNGGSGYEQATYDAFEGAYATPGGMAINGTADDNRPAAYLNYILFDEDMVYYQHGHAQISTAADMNHEKISLNDIVAPKAGFVYVYVSNESVAANWTYFDDMKVTVSESKIIQADSYYPFGLTFDSYQRMTAKKNDFLFNGIERVTELDLGWDLAHFRAYDPAIGRWLQIDPKTSERESPYVGFANMPNFYIDPLGDTIEYGNYTINNFWDDTYMGRDLQRIGSAAYDATLGKLGDWIDSRDKESTTEEAIDWNVTIDGERAGADSRYSVTANPLEDNSIMEQEFLDGVTAGAQALKVDAPLEWGESLRRVADAVSTGAKAANTGDEDIKPSVPEVQSDTVETGRGVHVFGTKADTIKSEIIIKGDTQTVVKKIIVH